MRAGMDIPEEYTNRMNENKNKKSSEKKKDKY